MSRSITVVLPTYNRAGRAERAVRSALAQTHDDLDLVVVDDGSTDDTVARLEAIADPRLRVLRHAANRGAQAARNTGVAAATGEFVAWLDSDDVWHPDKLRRQLALFEAGGPELGTVYCWYAFVDDRGEVLDVGRPEARGWVFDQLLHTSWTGTSSTVVTRRSLLREAGPFDETLPSAQDWDMCLRLARLGRFDLVPEVLVECDAGGSRISTDLQNLIGGFRAIGRKYQVDIERLGGEVAATHAYRLGVHLCLAGEMAEGRHYLLRSVRPLRSGPKNLGTLMLTALGAHGFRVATALNRRFHRWRHCPGETR